MIKIECIPDRYIDDEFSIHLKRRSRHRKVSTAARQLVRIARRTKSWHRTGQIWGHVELRIYGQLYHLNDIDVLSEAVLADVPYRIQGCPTTTGALERFVANCSKDGAE